jgi:hypothetical protein
MKNRKNDHRMGGTYWSLFGIIFCYIPGFILLLRLKVGLQVADMLDCFIAYYPGIISLDNNEHY